MFAVLQLVTFVYAQVTLPGEGRDRVFKVTMKWLAQVNLYTLEEALEGRTRTIPYDAIQVPHLSHSLDSVWKHHMIAK